MDTATKTERRATPWNEGKLLAQKPPEAEGDLGHPDSTAAGTSSPGTRAVQPCDRQQVARVRSGRASRPRRGPGQSRRRASDCHAEEDPATGSVRDHRTHARRGRGMDQHGALEGGAVPLSKPSVRIASTVDTAVFPDRRVVGGVDWTRPGGLRHPFNAAHQTDADIPADQESSGRPTSPRP